MKNLALHSLPGRQRDYYTSVLIHIFLKRLGESKCCEFVFVSCLQKCKFDEGGVSRLEFEARAIRYSKISHPRLAKIQALFYDKVCDKNI